MRYNESRETIRGVSFLESLYFFFSRDGVSHAKKYQLYYFFFFFSIHSLIIVLCIIFIPFVTLHFLLLLEKKTKRQLQLLQTAFLSVNTHTFLLFFFNNNNFLCFFKQAWVLWWKLFLWLLKVEMMVCSFFFSLSLFSCFLDLWSRGKIKIWFWLVPFSPLLVFLEKWDFYNMEWLI